MKLSKEPVTRVMVFGTFDHLHKGHLDFFKQAKNLAKKSLLIVSVARDKNVKWIKGERPDNQEKKRVRNLRKLGLIDKVVLGGITNHIPHIVKEKPDIIAFGYDQVVYTVGLKEQLEKKGLKIKIKRLKPHKPHLYKSSFHKRTPGVK